MDNVLFTCTVDFTHGAITFQRRGDTAIVPEHLAKEWQAAGLGTIKPKPRMANKMLPDSLGNVGGPGASSVASPAARASQPTTSKPSAPGTLSLPKKGG